MSQSATDACPMCGSRGAIAYADLSDRFFGVAGKWNSRVCENPACGLLWIDPMPLPADIPKLYANYLTHAVTPKGPGEDLFIRTSCPYTLGYSRAKLGFLERMLGWLISWCSPFAEVVAGKLLWLPASKTGRLLDLGCGNGSFLERAREFGWHVAGLEPDPVSCDLARAKGLEVHCGSVDNCMLPDASFDVVTMSHVIEHVPDPVKTLTECRRLLKPGGWIVMVTPNTESLGRIRFGKDWLGLDAPRHLMLFNVQNMETLLRSAGFVPRVVATRARQAYLICAVGMALARAKELPGIRLSPMPWLAPARLLFHLREYFASLRQPRGEELYVVGEKP